MQKPTYLKIKLHFVIHLILTQTILCINIGEIKFIFDIKARKKNIKCFIVYLGLFPPFYFIYLFFSSSLHFSVRCASALMRPP